MRAILFISFALITSLTFFATKSFASQIDIPGPVGSGSFGSQVVTLPNGNIVVSDPGFDEGGVNNIGAVYLYDGATLALISRLKGSTAGDGIGNGSIIVLANGNFVVPNGTWDNGPAIDAGAVTFCDGMMGCEGVVSPANSLVGSSSADSLGLLTVTVLQNGNYVVSMTDWDRPSPAAANVGAVTFCSGSVGCVGAINASNSLIGAQAGDRVGLGTGINITVLADSDYVVNSRTRRISTFCSGVSGCIGSVSSLNSLFGGDDAVALTNGNYVVPAAFYFGPDANPNNPNPYGAVIFCSGTTGCVGTANSNPSLRGSAHAQSVGVGGVTALPNGNYVVSSPRWDNASPAVSDVGAVTLCSGATGCDGFIDATNSLLGSTAFDLVGRASDPGSPFSVSSLAVLADGNYAVASSNWDNASVTNVGAVTWCSGTTGCIGHVTPANSLIGSSTNDRAGDFGSTVSVFPLKNGGYVVNSPFWNSPSPALTDVGAATFCNGATNSCAGQVISAVNSLIGSRAGDQVGNKAITAAAGCGGSSGYVVSSPNWDNGAIADAGAVTFCDGEAGCTGFISSANSFVGSKASDLVGNGGTTALPDGSFVIVSTGWDNGATTNVGAVTFCNGIGCTGAISSLNSLVGSTSNDLVGGGGLTVLVNGNYLVNSTNWDNGGIADAGAVTWCNGTGGCVGSVSASNSLVGSHPSDQVGLPNFHRQDLPNGNYVVSSPNWDNAAIVNAGAVTFASGASGATGVIDSVSSVLGTTPNVGGQFWPSYDQTGNRLFVGRGGSNAVSIIFFESTAVADGSIHDPAVWSGSVPNSLSNVVIPAGRTVTVDTPATIGNLSIAGGANFIINANVTLAGNLQLGTQINSGAHTLTLSCPSRVVGASGSNYIVGNLEKFFCTTDAFSYATGTASGYSPVSVTPTSVCAGSSSLTVRANEGNRAGMNVNQSTQRYWSLTETGSLTANFTFNYLDGDVRGDESSYQLYKWSGSSPTLVQSVLNTGANTASANDISDFSDWAIGNLAPTAAHVTVSGRVLTPTGAGVAGAIVIMSDNSGATRSARSSTFGYYTFENVEIGQTYFFQISSKRYQFDPRAVPVIDSMNELNFVAVSSL